VFLSSKHKFIFIHIPRTGGTSLELSLAPLIEEEPITFDLLKLLIPNANRILLGNKFSDIKHYIQPELKELLDKLNVDYSDWYEFTFVRNPYDRILSIYEIYGRTDNFNFMHKDYITKFDDFLLQLNYLPQLSEFHKPQVYWIRNTLTSNIHIHKFENLKNEWVLLCDKLGLGSIPLLHKQKTKYNSKIVLTDEQKDRIYQIYKDDFLELGYDK
jgi:hypothetical protein